MTEQTKALTPVENIKNILGASSVTEQITNAMADHAPLFISSVIDLFASDTYLQKCKPSQVVAECLKAATLKLPINKSLGLAYIVPYGKSRKVGNEWIKEQIPQFQIGWKGFVQLAMRTGMYRFINADVIYEGENKGYDKLTGSLDLTGKKTSDKVVGYFAYIENLNGFKKTVYGSVEDITEHAKTYSEAYKYDLTQPEKKRKSAWSTNFDAMALKTLVKQVLSKYGIMSVEMITAFSSDNNERTAEENLDYDMDNDANGDIIDIEPENVPEEPPAPQGPKF